MTKADDAVKRVEGFLQDHDGSTILPQIAELAGMNGPLRHHLHAMNSNDLRTILAELEGLRSKANISAPVTEDVARAIWECNVDEVTFDEAKAANDGKGDAAYNFNMLMAQAAVWAVENHIKSQSAEIERLRGIVKRHVSLCSRELREPYTDGPLFNESRKALKGEA